MLYQNAGLHDAGPMGLDVFICIGLISQPSSYYYRKAHGGSYGSPRRSWNDTEGRSGVPSDEGNAQYSLKCVHRGLDVLLRWQSMQPSASSRQNGICNDGNCDANFV